MQIPFKDRDNCFAVQRRAGAGKEMRVCYFHVAGWIRSPKGMVLRRSILLTPLALL